MNGRHFTRNQMIKSFFDAFLFGMGVAFIIFGPYYLYKIVRWK